MFSAQWCDEDEEIVDDPAVIQLACWESGVYDKETWRTGEVSDDVWDVVHKDRVQEVTARIEAGASWEEAVFEEGHYHVVRLMDQVSFVVKFVCGADRGAITGTVGWIGAEVRLFEGTYDQIRTEAHRLVDLAVARGRCSKYANKAAGTELKRNLTHAWKFARSAPRTARRK